MDEDQALAAIASLNEPLRRRVYRHVAELKSAVTRDAVASALGVSRSVAVFHLDKLAETGLLEVEYRRPPGRSGPGAGRPAKLYRPSAREISLSIPERRYEVAARLLAGAVEAAVDGEQSVGATLATVAREYGKQLGEGLAQTRGVNRRRKRAIPVQLAEVLSEQGYEPQVQGDIVILRNCPFHGLVETNRQLVCGMNLEVVRGLAEAAGLPEDAVHLRPDPDRCCVVVAAR